MSDLKLRVWTLWSSWVEFDYLLLELVIELFTTCEPQFSNFELFEPSLIIILMNILYFFTHSKKIHLLHACYPICVFDFEMYEGTLKEWGKLSTNW